MPFAEEFNDIWRFGIQQACSDAGAYAERVDTQIFHESIRQRVYTQIDKADVIVAEMTGHHPNVFYETGYAHALGKRVILVAKTREDIPFDLMDFQTVIYKGSIDELNTQLSSRVRHYITNPTTTRAPKANTVMVQVNDVALATSRDVTVAVAPGSNELELAIDVHNSAVEELRVIRCQVGLVTPLSFRRATSGDQPLNTVVLTEGTALHYVPRMIELLPGGWEKLSITPAVTEGTIEMNAQIALMIRVFTEGGYFDSPFTVTTKRRERR